MNDHRLTRREWLRRAATGAAALVAPGSLLAAGATTKPTGNTGGYRGPRRNGVFPAEGLLRKWPEGGPRLLWQADDIGAGYGAPCVADGMVFVTGAEIRRVPAGDGEDKATSQATGTLFAFDLDGKLKWKVACGPEAPKGSFPGPRATPSVSDGCVYIAGAQADVYCHEAASGKLLWKLNIWADLGDGGGKKRLGWGYNESPLIVDDLLIVNACSTSRDGAPVVAVDKRTGRTVWKADPGPGNLSAGDGSVAAARCAGRTLVVAHTYRKVLGLDAKTGQALWTLEPNGGAGMTPVCLDGHLLLRHQRGLRLMKLSQDGQTCEEVWAVEHAAKEDPPRVTPVEILSYQPPVVLGDTIYISKYRHTDRTQTWLGAMKLTTGEEIWSRASQRKGWPPQPPTFAAAEGLLYVLEGGPRCSLARPTAKGLEEISAFRPVLGGGPTYTHPVIAEVRLFLRQGRRLAVYDIRAKRTDCPTSTKGHE